MKLSLAFITALLPVAASARRALEGAAIETNPQDCIEDAAAYPPGTDFFPDKFIPHETTDLVTIDYHETYKIVTNKFTETSYLLYQCGTEPPADEVASGAHQVILPVPHRGGVAITQTPQIAPVELLGKRSEIRAYIGNPLLVSSPCLKNVMTDDDSFDTIYFPDDPYNSTLIDAGAESYLADNPDALVFSGPMGNSFGERHVAFAASQEKTAVATFDWLGMYAALFNLEGMANEIIADTEERYRCSAENAAMLSADVQDDARPKILWAQYFDGIGWSVADCPTWDEAYYCEYAQHCGAEIISRPEGVGFSQSYGGPRLYWYVNDTEFLELGKDAETWIYPSKTFEAVYNVKKDILDQFKSVQNENVYDTQGSGPHAWHEQRLAEYDVVALDMCDIVGTNNPDGAVHRRRWFRSYFDEAIGDLGSCDVDGGEIDMAYVPAQAQCTPIELSSGEGGEVEEEQPSETAAPSDATADEEEEPGMAATAAADEDNAATSLGAVISTALFASMVATIVAN